MKTALIGYTGFVGSNIFNQYNFDEVYNSKNINQVKGQSFDLVVCAGVPAVKWWANQNPRDDLMIINELESIYKSINTKRFVLISTVDVYPVPINVTEKSPIELEMVCPYGKHRLMLERALQECFDNFHVIRLPGLFGQGLKKNILFDMLCGNILEKINLDSSFQWYPLSRIWMDIQTVIKAQLPLVNLAVEPISTGLIKDAFFNEIEVGNNPLPTVRYDMKTDYSSVFNSSVEGYVISVDEVMVEMAKWLKAPGVKCG